jgi:hypothetical protein
MRKSAFAAFASFGFVMTALVMAVAPIGGVRAQSFIQQRNAAAAALAEALRAEKAPYEGITFESAEVYDSLVEVKYVVTDSVFFSRMKSADANYMRQFRARDYCSDSRIAYLQQGASVYEIFATSDHSGGIYVSVSNSTCMDRSVCEALGKTRDCIRNDRPVHDDRPWRPKKDFGR